LNTELWTRPEPKAKVFPESGDGLGGGAERMAEARPEEGGEAMNRAARRLSVTRGLGSSEGPDPDASTPIARGLALAAILAVAMSAAG
jgi:hypothetical protein